MTWIGNWDAYSVQKGNIVTISKDTKQSKSTSQLHHRIKGKEKNSSSFSFSRAKGYPYLYFGNFIVQERSSTLLNFIHNNCILHIPSFM